MAKSRKLKRKKNGPDNTAVEGAVIFSAAFAIFLSILSFCFTAGSRNALGLLGHNVGLLFTALFGVGSYFICLFAGWVGWRLFFNKPINKPITKLIHASVFVVSLCMLLSLIEVQLPMLGQFFGSSLFPALWKTRQYYHLGGAPAYFIYNDLPIFNLQHIINHIGVALIFTTALLTTTIYLLKIDPIAIAKWILERLEKEPQLQPAVEGNSARLVKLGGTTPTEVGTQEMLAIQPEVDLKTRPSLSRKTQEEPKTKAKEETVEPYSADISRFRPAPAPPQPTKKEKALAAQKVYNGDFTNFKLPSINLLTDPKIVDQSSLKRDLKRQAEVLEETLHSFGIEAKVGQINCGPTITSFEVHPSIGVKVQRIKALENDIALNMEAKSIRIIAPIPGKAAVGIEVPNPQPQEVSFKEMLRAYQRQQRKSIIPLLMGKAVNGDSILTDLTRMPHLLIAGATGSGKSVCINTIVMSILMTARPDEIKMIMIDPKKVELNSYTRLPHMLAPVITEPRGACAAMKWLVKEMESRYELFKQVGMRNIEAFNNRVIDEKLEKNLDTEIPKRLPYIMCIIDELADLMMVAHNDIETPIARIAQMARAVGLHLVLATQRPSREVITGLIKANFPTRISFKVASRVNSQIVLDEIGAESLLGNGDMLFLPPGTSQLIRAQGSFVRDEDINKVVQFVCEQAPPNYVIDSFDDMDTLGEGLDGLANEPTDDLYDQALEVILSTGNASTTFLQRKLKIGYARAASIVDQMEARGVLGPADGAKPRKILIRGGESDPTLFD